LRNRGFDRFTGWPYKREGEQTVEGQSRFFEDAAARLTDRSERMIAGRPASDERWRPEAAW